MPCFCYACQSESLHEEPPQAQPATLSWIEQALAEKKAEVLQRQDSDTQIRNQLRRVAHTRQIASSDQEREQRDDSGKPS